MRPPTSLPACFTTSHNTHFYRLPTLTLPAIEILFFVLNNSTISMVKVAFGFSVGDHFVLYEFEVRSEPQMQVDVAVKAAALA